MERLALTEAARRLGISEEALRKRIARGKVISEKTDDGHVHVLIEGDETPDSPTKAPAPAVAAEAGPTDPESLRQELERLWQQINRLNQELERERQARAEEQRRHDHIIMAMVTKMPALKAGLPLDETANPTAAVDSTLIAAAMVPPAEAPPAPIPPPPAPKLPWWKRLWRKPQSL